MHMHAIGMEETVFQNMFMHWLIIKEQQLSNIMIFTQDFLHIRKPMHNLICTQLYVFYDKNL